MNIEEVKKLRARTGAGLMDCKKALSESGQDVGKALDWLKKRGLAKASKKALRETKQGRISTYIHGEGRIGVLVEVNAETDFASRGEDFKTFSHQLCLHIAAMNPLFIRQEDVPPALLKKEEDVFREQAIREKKPPLVAEKIAKGRIKKWLSEVCLMEQTFLMSTQGDSPQTVAESLTGIIAKLGENIRIRRFVRFELGEEIEPLSKNEV